MRAGGCAACHERWHAVKKSINSRNKGKVGEREFAEVLRTHGFDARRGQQFAGGTDSPDVVSTALDWLHVEVKRVEHLNLAEACAQAKRDASGKPWIVAHRKNRGPWFITMAADELGRVLHKVAPFLDVWPFRALHITLEAELFFQFLRELQRRRHTDEHGFVLPPDETKAISSPVLTDGQSFQTGTSAREDARPTNTISSPVLADGHKAGSEQQNINQELRP